MDSVNGEMFINARRSTKKLETLCAFKGSAARYAIHAPRDVDGLTFQIGSGTADSCKYDAGKRCWTAYLAPAKLPTAGTFAYQIAGADDRGNAVIFGRGKITVSE